MIQLKKYLKERTTLAILVALSLTVMSCDTKDEINAANSNPSATAFNNIRESALANLTQNFQVNAANGVTTWTSNKGVQVIIDSSCLRLNGSAITGIVDIEYVEIFDGGDMLVTNKTTMGKLPNGDMAMIITGGAFYINATQNGQQLTLNCNMNLKVPANLTALHADMILWDGTINAAGDLVWEEQPIDAAGGNGVQLIGTGNNPTYNAFFSGFGWTNIDRFFNHMGPKTQILVKVPEGYNYENSAVYLHYDGEGNALAKLDMYDEALELFSEHYGQIPVGLECHLIFATEDNGNWRYAIKPITIAENDIYQFILAETNVLTEAQLKVIINGLP